jgi:hypothetical protein
MTSGTPLTSGLRFEEKGGVKSIVFNPKAAARESVVKRLVSQRSAAGITTQTPLSELKEALDDPTEANKFIADPMFWNNYTDIDQSRIFKTTSVEFKNLNIMFWEFILYTVFVFFFSIFVFTLQSEAVYESRRQQQDYWLGCTATSCSTESVVDMGTFWDWMKNDLIERAFPDVEPLEKPIANITTSFTTNGYPTNGYVIVNNPRMVGSTNTEVLLGAIRVRQLRVTKDVGCEVSALFAHVFPHCYAEFSDTVQSFERFSTRYTPTYLLPSFEWRQAEDTLGAPMRGQLTASYPADGYYFDVPADRVEAEIIFEDLYKWKWVDQATRAVIIELNVMSTNTNVLVNTKMLFEFGPTGTVRPSTNMNAFRALFVTLAMGEGEELAIFLFQIFIFAQFMVMLGYLLWCGSRVGLVKFLSFKWNILDLALIAMFTLYMLLRISVVNAIAAEPNLQPDVVGHPEVFMPFSRNFTDLILASRILSFLCLFVYVKYFKYAVLIGYFRNLADVVVECLGRLVLFAVLIIVMFFGFGLAFNVGLGQYDWNYATFDRSFLGLFFRFIEGIRLEPSWFESYSGASGLVGPLLALAFLILVTFVLSNVFMAIVLEAYVSGLVCVEVRKVAEDLQKRNPMFLFLYTYYHKMRRISLGPNEEVLPEDASISLTDLPGIVVRKWLDKKKRMQMLVDKTLGTVGTREMMRKLSKGEAPGSTASRKKKAGPGMWYKVKIALQQLFSLPEASEFEYPEPDETNSRIKLYPHVGEEMEEDLTLDQLQALMDHEPMLQILLGTKNGIDVVKFFKERVPLPGEEELLGYKITNDPLERVAELQEGVFRKVELLEKAKLNMNRNSVPFVDDLADEIQHLLQGVQNEWREELTSLMEVLTNITDAMMELKMGIDTVGQNQQGLRTLLEGDEEDEEGSSSSSSSESSEDDRE